jgi:hypothetical protein
MRGSPEHSFHLGDRRRAAFTLLELLTAFCVLTLLILLMSQMWSAAGASAQEGKRRIDNSSKARSTLDVFARDVRCGIFRSDLAAFVNDGGTTAISLYTQRPGVGADVRNLSLVIYQIDKDKARLRRGTMPLRWTDDAEKISLGNTNTLPETASITPEDVANGILRAGIYFVDSSGTISKTYSNKTRAVGITLATVDEETLKVLSSAQLARLTAHDQVLPDDPSSSPTQTLKGFWEAKIATSGFFDGYPSQLRSGLRIFERYVMLPVD